MVAQCRDRRRVYRPALLAQGLGYNGGNLEEQGMTPPG